MYYNNKNIYTCADIARKDYNCKNINSHDHCSKCNDEDLIHFYSCPFMNFLPIMCNCPYNNCQNYFCDNPMCPSNFEKEQYSNENKSYNYPMMCELNPDYDNCSTYNNATDFQDYNVNEYYNKDPYYDDIYFRNYNRRKPLCPYY